MRDKLKTGDKIIINKTLFSGCIAPVLRRISVFPTIKRNDILVFKINSKEDTYFVKRCIAIPGDEIAIVNDQVYINRKEAEEDEHVRHRYRVWYRSYTDLQLYFDKESIDYLNDNMVRNSNYIALDLSSIEMKKLLGAKAVDSIKIDIKYNWQLTDPEKHIDNAKLSNLPNVKIPQKGMKLILSQKNYLTYNDLIEKYEGTTIEEKGDRFQINGKTCRDYIFKNDYVFLMGDNRINSSDSRVFGPIPTSNITGKYISTIMN